MVKVHEPAVHLIQIVVQNTIRVANLLHRRVSVVAVGVAVGIFFKKIYIYLRSVFLLSETSGRFGDLLAEMFDLYTMIVEVR
jgi:hypothetical protein